MKKMFLAMICFTAIVSTVVAQDKVKFDPVNEEPEVAVPAGCACACARVIVPVEPEDPIEKDDPTGGEEPAMSDFNSAGQAGGQRPVWRLFRRR